MSNRCHIEPYTDTALSLKSALEAIDAPAILQQQKRILIKPNLVNDSPPPVTTPVAFVEALVSLLRSWTDAEICIAEGTGAAALTTAEVYRILGYSEMAERLNLCLVDLNDAPLRTLQLDGCEVFPQIHLPEILFDSFLISVAMLKAHSLSGVTLSMKNLIGCAPPRYYQQGGHWKKSLFHQRMHRSIFELNRYRTPDLALIDGGIGLAEYHLGGPTCDPPVQKLIAGFDPVSVDAAGAGLLGFDWQTIEHIRMADGVLGRALNP